MARGFPDVQVFFEFLTDLNNPQKRKTIDQQVVHLLDNLDPSGKTNTALELAKIYSWYLQTYTYTPPSDLTDPTDLGYIELKESILPSTNKYQDVMVGVYDENTGEFYTNSAKTTIIPHNANNVYVDTATNSIWRYDPTHSPAGYVKIMGSGGGGGTYLFREGTEPDSFDVSDDGGTSWQSVSINPTSYIAGDGISINQGSQPTDISSLTWEVGSINPTNGSDDDTTTSFIRSPYIEAGLTSSIGLSPSYNGNDVPFKIAFYDSNHDFISMTNSWNTSINMVDKPYGCSYTRVLLTVDESTVMDPSNLDSCVLSYPLETDKHVVTNSGVIHIELRDSSIKTIENGNTGVLITFGDDLFVDNGVLHTNIQDNITGTGESGKIAMFDGSHTITTGTVSKDSINETTCDIEDGILSFTLTPKSTVTDITLDLSND